MSPQDPMPFGKHKGVKICDVDPSYKSWMLKQEGFKEKNPDLAACFEGKAPTVDELETDTAEDLLMSDAPDGFGDWWWKQYGKNLRREKSSLYLGYLRVALEAWKAGQHDLHLRAQGYDGIPSDSKPYNNSTDPNFPQF